MLTDLFFIFTWWATFFFIGLIFLRFTTSIFSGFFDRGYIFSKILGFIFISYAVFFLGLIHFLPFTRSNIFIVLLLSLIPNFIFLRKKNLRETFFNDVKAKWKIFLFEEVLFFLTLAFWSFIKGFQPDIHGLEKFMDYGFINSILRADYFPPRDMWFTPFPINYYYFGHFITAVLTKISGIPSFVSYNLMLATIFALTFTGSFSIGANLIRRILPIKTPTGADWRLRSAFIGGLLSGFLVTLAGNLHTIYAFFKPYPNETVKPLWELAFSPQTFPNSYWYPNATRFVYNTIHEFPSYSFVVSDLHGHVLDIPMVLLTIALLFSLLYKPISHFSSLISHLVLIGFLLAVMYMTNAWDGIIYFLLTILVLIFLFLRKNSTSSQAEFKIVNSKSKKEILNFKSKSSIYYLLFTIFILFFSFYIFSRPFSLNFKPFVSGIGVLCAPSFLTNLGKFGPFLFEKDHCQHSPLWQLATLYGFFYFWAISFVIFLRRELYAKRYTLISSDLFVIILIFLSTTLIFIPEFLYAKDIYPAHYRANTMFKLVYQAFIMLSISSGYIIIRIITNIKFQISNIQLVNWKLVVLVFIGSIGLFLVMIYPFFSVNSYFGNLKTYYGLNGLSYLEKLYPDDYKAIEWINENIKGQPVILEAQGDSYTDYARVSANTGLPTVLGWTVHEWLWRKTYDVPAPRIPEVQTLYESNDILSSKELIRKYNIKFVFVGDLERQKYANLNEEKFQKLGTIIFQKGQTKIYKIKI